MKTNFKINHSNPIPLYYQLRQQIRNNILDGLWPDGSEVPSEPKLAKELGLSRATVKQAYDGLVNEGLLIRKQGRGSFVRYQQSEFNIIQEPNFYQKMDSLGAKQVSKIIESGYLPADSHIARKLNIEPGEEVCYFKRVRQIDDIPSIIQTVFIRKEYATNLLETDLASISFHRYIEETVGVSLNCFDMMINAIILDSYECKLFKLKQPIPGFRFHTIYWNNDIPVIYNERIFRGENLHLALKFSFSKDAEATPQINTFGVYKNSK